MKYFIPTQKEEMRVVLVNGKRMGRTMELSRDFPE
jgi:hypothetical protein